MPAIMEPMTTESNNVITQQPNTSEQQPEMTLRGGGGEEAGCSICCGLCACEEGCF
ncbi:hypothetical protein E4U22_000192 [Claviceps purpurea]|uniref:Uncharacterized protein n=1 Tax=Claviceps purpurea (strain 20.1) TaxID=1111077 RepID=M1W3N1_CLAP2|nr:hypothetical protein E4U38_008070 [Claviceps purpurea]CCE28635.1 uncharacterized protein CPUR_02323 [Claviceps purpurea 20.1]KAG6124918.1 hypothetical protein E4U12_007804 [Claviceps purpurea]KAG6139905.1 hypothetical protein E4U28_003618 [Claviceps purpurea]KAG6157630.1 hypothetical protein E4U37_007053 [Claviceps purpurea]